MGDVAKEEYTYKRQILEHELAALEPPVVNDAEEAAASHKLRPLLGARERCEEEKQAAPHDLSEPCGLRRGTRRGDAAGSLPALLLVRGRRSGNTGATGLKPATSGVTGRS
jgi:hypothetical protein